MKIRKPVPTPRKTVKELVKQHENNYKPVPAPGTESTTSSSAIKTQIHQTIKALKGFTKLFEISLKTDKDPLVQLQNTRVAIERLFGTIRKDTKGFKFVETMKVNFIKRKVHKNI